MLRKYRKGITPLQFPTGFRLGARIFQLRHEYGMDIENIKEAELARYVLVSEGK